MKQALLSICIPIHNRANYLELMLKRFMEDVDLFDEKIDLFISDNCSEDDLGAIVKRYTEQGLRMRYHRNEENIGGDLNICACFKAGRGKYTLVLGSDDIPVSGSLRYLMSLLEEDYGVVHINFYDNRPERETSFYKDTERFFADMHAWITLISINAVATKYIKGFPLEQYASRNLAHVPLYLKAAFAEGANLVVYYPFLSENLTGNDRTDGGDYNAFRVFVANLLDIMKESVERGQMSRKTYEEIKKNSYKNILTNHIVNLLILRRTNYNRESKKGWSIVYKYYGHNFYAYYLLLWRILYSGCNRIFVKKLHLGGERCHRKWR